MKLCWRFVSKQKRRREERKNIQEQQEKRYAEYKKDLREKIKLVEEYDMKDKMKSDVREFIAKYKYENKGEPPRHLGLYYDRFNVDKREELDENQVKAKENLAKEKLKKEQDKAKKEESGATIKSV